MLGDVNIKRDINYTSLILEAFCSDEKQVHGYMRRESDPSPRI